jgi:hypothetical protein
MNAPDPLHWTKTHDLERFGPFRYRPKLDAELAKVMPLMHKLAKQSRVGIFCNERTRSTPMDPKLMFWSVPDRFVMARMSMQNWPS